MRLFKRAVRYSVPSLLLLLCCTSCQPSANSDTNAAAEEPGTQQFIVPRLDLTMAWNHEKFNVPPPVLVPDGMRRSDSYRRWWGLGDVETLQWTAPDGTRYVAEAKSRIVDSHERVYAFIPALARFRPDGTLESVTRSSFPPDPPSDWTLYGPDGKTKVLSVTCDLAQRDATPYVQWISFFDAQGREVRRLGANRLGIIDVEIFFKPSGGVDHWNGSGTIPPLR